MQKREFIASYKLRVTHVLNNKKMTDDTAHECTIDNSMLNFA